MSSIRRAHRFMYGIGALLIIGGLAALFIAAGSDGSQTAAWLTGAVLLVGGLCVIWAGLRLAPVIEGMTTSVETAFATGGATSPQFDDLWQTLSSAGIDLDPKVFEQAHVTTSSHVIDVRQDSGDEADLRTRGRATTATVESFQPLMQLGDRTVAMLGLRVAGPDGETYEVQHGGFVPQAVAERLSQGMQVPLLVDPDQPQRVFVDWERV